MCNMISTGFLNGLLRVMITYESSKAHPDHELHLRYQHFFGFLKSFRYSIKKKQHQHPLPQRQVQWFITAFHVEPRC